MKVIIMYRNNFSGGDGWTYYPMTVEISDYCPKCGEKRGTPRGKNFYEDGETFYVNVWENPCGHVDYYKDCYLESITYGKWIKIAEGLPKIEGRYRVKRRYTDNEEVGYFTGKEFTNYEGYAVVEWFDEITIKNTPCQKEQKDASK